MIEAATRRARQALGRAARPVMRLDPLAALPRAARPAGVPLSVGLVGFFGWGNFGDELFLDVFREHLGPTFGLRTLVDPGVPRSITRRLGGDIRTVDAIVIGGGDLVIPWSQTSRYWEAAYLRRPVFIVGVGVPTFRRPQPAVVARLARFMGHPSVRLIGTRDVASAAWITRNLRPAAPVVTAPDLVYARTLPEASRPPGPPILGVAVRASRTPDYLRNLRRLCERAMERGYRVRRLALANGPARRSEEAALEELGLPQSELVSSEDLSVVCRAIGECSLVASMKFHGVVVASMYGVPALALGATAKHKHLMTALGLSEQRIPFTDAGLPDALDHELVSIDRATRERLRSEVIALLGDVRDGILAATSTAAAV